MTEAEVDLLLFRRAWVEGWACEALLDERQLKWVKAFWEGPPLPAVWSIGRQVGKTFAMSVMAFDFALKTPGAIIRYCARTKESAASIMGPTMRQITASMPEELRPVAGRSEFEWVFPSSGATFVVFGTDAQSFSRGRGPRTHLQLFDEYAFFQDLEEVENALLPSLQTTAGRVLYLSSPPASMAHPSVKRIQTAMAVSRCQVGTFWDNPRINHESVIASECSRLGLTRDELLKSTAFRREYLAELVTEESRAAIPAWTQEMHKRLVVHKPRPRFFDAYQSGDFGRTGDPHAWLFAWYDFETSTVHIERELELRAAENTGAGLADEVKKIERELYGVDSWNGKLLGADDWRREFGELPEYIKREVAENAPRQPFLRVGDNDGFVLNTLCTEYGLVVLPTAKHNKYTAVDFVNQRFVEGRITIDPRCSRLIEQLYTTVWNNSRTSWERIPGRDHGDLIDCLCYLLRSIQWHRDPRPPPVGEFFSQPKEEKTGLESMAGLF